MSETVRSFSCQARCSAIGPEATEHGRGRCCDSSQCSGEFVALCLWCWASLVMLSHASAAACIQKKLSEAGDGASGEYWTVADGSQR